jgi:hypothetical protein
VVLGVAMIGETAHAEFDNEQVQDAAKEVTVGVGAINHDFLQEADISRRERAFFLAGFASIVRDSRRIADLARQPDHRVADDIEDLAQNVNRTVSRLADHAVEIGFYNDLLNTTFAEINDSMNQILWDVE